MHESIADLEEKELIRSLLADPHWRQRLLGLHGVGEGSVYPEIPLAGLGTLEGDIDLMLVPTGRPEQCTVVQIKRVKVSAASFDTDLPNKLGELRKLRNQTNPLARAGFWKVYAFVLVVVDSRTHNVGQFSYAGLTASLRDTIERAISVDGLDARVGLVHYEFVQPIDDRPLGAGTFKLRPKRLATEEPQPIAVTNWVQEAVSRSSEA